MLTTYYTVWYCRDGDIFKGYDNVFVSSHLDLNVANETARLNSGWVDTEVDNLHPDYIEQLKDTDLALKEARLKLSNSVRSMLSDGG